MQRYFGSKAEQHPAKAASQVEQANGVTRMMQQCTAMLRDRMGDDACTPLQAATLRYNHRHQILRLGSVQFRNRVDVGWHYETDHMHSKV